jgi:hypothetical protein
MRIADCILLSVRRINAQQIFVGKPEGRRPFERKTVRRWDDNIKIYVGKLAGLC